MDWCSVNSIADVVADVRDHVPMIMRFEYPKNEITDTSSLKLPFVVWLG